MTGQGNYVNASLNHFILLFEEHLPGSKPLTQNLAINKATP